MRVFEFTDKGFPDDPHYGLGPVHMSLYVRITHWHGPPQRARAETGGADQWVIKRRELLGFARVNQVTSASLGYPLSIFNKHSTLRLRLLYGRPDCNTFFPFSGSKVFYI